MKKTALVIHGGAGTISRREMTADLEKEYRRGLENGLQKGWEILSKSGTALDAVEAAVSELENFPLFNAGRGAVFTNAGKNEMDASIMDGKKLKAGGVAFVKNIKNPIRLARLVMQKTEHVLLAGEGAEEFARQMKAEFADDEYFFTEHRYRQFLQALQSGKIMLDHNSTNDHTINPYENMTAEEIKKADSKSKMGTVGAVACDDKGNLAAATSTGGMTNKKFGRIGDSPIIGAGTYAENTVCAVSGTGHGEFFMRGVAAYDVAARMKYKNISIDEAARETIERLDSIGGEGGLICVDANGDVAMRFNSEGMYRAFIDSNGETKIEIYK